MTIIKSFFAHLVSVLFIPLLIPTYLFFIILFYFPQLGSFDFNSMLLVAGVFVGTSVLPLLLVLILFKLKIISSLSLEKREDRFIPQLFGCICYVSFSLFFIYKTSITNTLSLAMIANTLSLITITGITRYWKISTHASGALGLSVIVSVLYFKNPSESFLIPYLSILFLSVAVCVARLYLKAHTLSEVLGGCLLGTVIGGAVFCWLIF